MEFKIKVKGREFKPNKIDLDNGGVLYLDHKNRKLKFDLFEELELFVKIEGKWELIK